MKKLLALLCVAAMIFALAACGSSEPAATEAPAEEAAQADAEEAPAEEAQSYTIGICQLVQHPALDQATEGFKQALIDELGDSVTFNERTPPATPPPAPLSAISSSATR